MNTRNILIASVLGLGVFFATSCEKVLTDCEQTTYSTKVKAILDKSCNTAGCHDGSNSARKTLTSFENVNTLKDGILKRTVTDKNMPPAGALSAEDMETIQCWVDNGAKE